jgi:CheY-like chemotaxis protein
MKNKKLLLVDDDKDFVAAQSVLLGHEGYEIFTAHSGEEGFKKAGEVKPDLIVLDVNMETQNAGFDMNRKVRNDAALKHTPVVMLTGIETYSVTPQTLEMYNAMMAEGNFDLQEVLKVGNTSTNLGVQYKDDNGKPFYLPLDSFVSKANAETGLMPEIQRLIG